MTLLYPKVVLASVALVYTPYFFSLALLAELLLLMLYNKAIFGQFGVTDTFSYATVISPALFEMPTECRCKCIKSLKHFKLKARAKLKSIKKEIRQGAKRLKS